MSKQTNANLKPVKLTPSELDSVAGGRTIRYLSDLDTIKNPITLTQKR
jgi:hypothetical protein